MEDADDMSEGPAACSSNAVSASRLSRLFFTLGQVAIQHLVGKQAASALRMLRSACLPSHGCFELHASLLNPANPIAKLCDCAIQEAYIAVGCTSKEVCEQLCTVYLDIP